ncbi:MAG: STAS domain-containing protein [Solirubrobacterales bacterium]
MSLPDELKISAEGREGVTIVRVSGEVDLASHEQLTEQLRAAANGGDAVVVDLSGCSFIDSSGIRALLLGEREAERFALAGPGDQVMRVLEMTGVGQVVPIHASVDEALDDAAKG